MKTSEIVHNGVTFLANLAKEDSTYKTAKKAATAWAKAHPEAQGLVITSAHTKGKWKPGLGVCVFSVARGRVEYLPAREVWPAMYAAEDAAREANAIWRRENLMHPGCPLCCCVRERPKRKRR